MTELTQVGPITQIEQLVVPCWQLALWSLGLMMPCRWHLSRCAWFQSSSFIYLPGGKSSQDSQLARFRDKWSI